MKTGYTTVTGAGVALVANTAVTILGALTPATFGLDLLKLHLGMRSVTAADQPVLVELVAYTADGTGTAGTVNPVYGRGTTTASIPVGYTSKYAYTVEPTGPTVIDQWTLTPIGGTLIWDMPPNASYDVGINTLLGCRLTPGASITAALARATMGFERC